MGRARNSTHVAQRPRHGAANPKSRRQRTKVCNPKRISKCHLTVTKPTWNIATCRKRIENIKLRRLGGDKKVPMVAEHGDKKSNTSKWHRIGIFEYSGEFLHGYPLWKASVKVYSATKGLDDFIFASDYPPKPSNKSALCAWDDKRGLAYFLLRRSLENNQYDDFQDAGITAFSACDSRDSILLYKQLTEYFEKTLAKEIEDGYSPFAGGEDEKELHKAGWEIAAKILALDGAAFLSLNAMVSHLDQLLVADRQNRIMDGKWQLPWNLIAGIFILQLRTRDPDLADYLWNFFGNCDLNFKSFNLRQMDDEFKNTQQGLTKRELRRLALPSEKYGYLYDHEWSMTHVFYIMRKVLAHRRQERRAVQARLIELQGKLDEMSIDATELATIDAQQKQTRERLAKLTVEWDAHEEEPETIPCPTWKEDAEEEMKTSWVSMRKSLDANRKI